tara:strand:- start:2599 stop:3063 length:465 start_codon:yes stop_codon:yes gene_type:complete
MKRRAITALILLAVAVGIFYSCYYLWKSRAKPGAIATLLTGSNTYASGVRAGHLQKFTNKGLTGYWEAEIVLKDIDTASESIGNVWVVNVDESEEKQELRDQIRSLVGQNVRIFYDEKNIRGIDASSNYWITGVEIVPPLWHYYPLNNTAGAVQ